VKTSKLRVLLISPYYSYDSTLGPHDSIVLPPLGLEIIASHIKDLADVRIVDNRLHKMDHYKIKKILSKFNPHYVGISCNYTSQIYIVYKLASIAKKQNCRVVVGGWHPSVTVDETLSHQSIDIVVRGEGELTFRELLQKQDPTRILGLSYKKDGVIVHNPDRPLQKIRYLDLPNRKLRSFNARNTYNYLGFPIDCIETSRGCPYSCDFCSIHKFYQGSYRHREIADVIREIKSKEVMNHSGFIFITDDNFMVNKKYVMELCDAIIHNKIIKYFIAQVRVDSIVNHPIVFKRMAEAGFIYLFLGIESF
jgi:anaerobic magnesium-protoporphyrin IX monomethyl ester cyclase